MSIGPNILLSQIFTLSADGISTNANVSARDFQNIGVYLIGTGTAAFSVRVRGSMQDVPPNFSSASTIGNEWAYIQLKNAMTNTYYNGDTGYTFAANETVQLELNVAGLTWVSVEMFSHATGTLTAQFLFKDNQ